MAKSNVFSIRVDASSLASPHLNANVRRGLTKTTRNKFQLFFLKNYLTKQMPSTHTGWFWTLSKQNLQVLSAFIRNKEKCSNQRRFTELLLTTHSHRDPWGWYIYLLIYHKKSTIHVGINISVLRVVLGLKGNFVGLIPLLPGKPGTTRMIIICSKGSLPNLATNLR